MSISERPIAMDMWTLAGAAQALMHRDRHATPPAPSYNSGPDAQGYHFTLFDPDRLGRVVGELRFIRQAEATFVQVEVAEDFYAYCAGLVEFLDLLAGSAYNFRRAYEPTADEAIERYYRSRAAGSRVTLRQIAKDTGFSYGYLRTAKIAYDKVGKWGSKKRLSSDDDNKS